MRCDPGPAAHRCAANRSGRSHGSSAAAFGDPPGAGQAHAADERAASGPAKQVLEPLFAVHRDLHPKADLKLVQRAYEVAEKARTASCRKSGDPYITHPLAVATILADLGMDTTTLVAALLHDTVEDTDVHAGGRHRGLR